MPRRSVIRDQFTGTATGRPISRCPVELLQMANQRVPLRRVEIYTLAKASGMDVVSMQMMHMDEQSAIAKIREAFAGMSPSELIDERKPVTRKRRAVMR